MRKGWASLGVVMFLVATGGGVWMGPSPDGKRVAVRWTVADTARLAFGIADARGISFVSGAEVTGDPQWSPNGAWIAVPTSVGVRLWSVDAARFRIDLDGPTLGPVAWRPDGAQLAFVAQTDAGWDVVTYSVRDRQLVWRTRLPHPEPEAMTWLPRNDGLAVRAAGDIWLVEQGEVQRLTTTGDVVGQGLSHDGRTLFWARRGKNMGYILMTLFAYDLQARSVRRLPFPDRIQAMNPRPRVGPTALAVVFAPGAERMLVIGRGGPRGAVVVRRDGAEESSFPASAGSMRGVWSADGSTLVIAVTGAGRQVLTMFDADGSNARQIASAP